VTARAAPTRPAAQPAFLTYQSLVTFSGASAALAVAWKVLNAVIGASWIDHRLVPAALCALVGIYFIWKGVESQRTASDKFGAVLVGVFNTFFLLAAVLGIDTGLGAAGGPESIAGAP
jgi:hypothetical protein